MLRVFRRGAQHQRFSQLQLPSLALLHGGSALPIQGFGHLLTWPCLERGTGGEIGVTLNLSSITSLLPGASAFSLFTPEQEVFDGLDIYVGGEPLYSKGLPRLMPLHLPLKELSKGPVSVLFSTISGSRSPHLSLPCTSG